MIRILKTELKDIESYRIEYLKSLPAFQDLFVEFIVNDSDCYKLHLEDIPIGYAIISPYSILIELYIENKFIANCYDCFNTIVKELKIKSICSKSFDYLLLDCCITNQLPYRIIGYLYRDFIETEYSITSDLTARYADESDLSFLIQQDDEIFEPKQLLKSYVKNKRIILFKRDDQTVGCGFLTQIHLEFNYFDIGVWTHPDHRKKGYATRIISYLRETCLKNNRIPVCGCDIKNIASQKTLGKAGFISKYKLIEFDINDY